MEVTGTTSLDIAANLRRVRSDIDEAEARSGRRGEVALVAVTKTVDSDRVRCAYDAGQRLFGENRVQEGVTKIAALSPSMPDAEWHLIGNLQRNKARRAVESFSLIESVDSIRLAERLNDLAMQFARRLPILLEVNVAGESAKGGMTAPEVAAHMPGLLALSHIEIRGLMTVAPLVRDPEEVRPVFRRLRELRDEIRDTMPITGFHELSMGMSGDFQVAVEEGATMVRIGRAIFGMRPPH